MIVIYINSKKEVRGKRSLFADFDHPLIGSGKIERDNRDNESRSAY